MKKIIYISFLALFFASCQKEQIVPNYSRTQPMSTEKGTTGGGGTSTSGEVTTTGGTTTDDGTIDPGGDITDPMRRKDKKDNK